MNIWFTSDTHFGHANIIKYCNRPFKSVQEMDDTIINNWNSVVKKEDQVYHLGDFSFGNSNYYLDNLNGMIHIIWGNHDKQARQVKHRFRSNQVRDDITIDDISITLSHFAMRVWNKSHFNSYHLFGHSHGGLESFGKSFDVGVDTNNFFPYSWEEIKTKMNTLPDNFNFRKDKRND